MSKLIDLIRKLGDQAPQPLGFGALAGKGEVSPSMALIGKASVDELAAGMEAAGGRVDAIILDPSDPSTITDSEDLGDIVWGVGPGQVSNDDVAALAEAGCDFYLVDPESAPGAVVSHSDAAIIVAISEPADRETSAALRSLRVSGSLNTTSLRGGDVGFADLINVTKVGASTGGIMLIEAPEDASVANLTSLRDAGIDGLVVTLSDSDRVNELADMIRELPQPKKRTVPTDWRALAPQSSD